jgi:antitoxin VapB
MKTVKVINDGETQIINLPKEFEFEGNKVFIRWQGDEVVLSPYTSKRTKENKRKTR